MKTIEGLEREADRGDELHDRKAQRDIDDDAAAIAAQAIKVGDYVRSYDFPARMGGLGKGPFIEGRVSAFEKHQGCLRYVIKVERDVWPDLPGAAMSRVGVTVLPPLNGTRKLLGGVCNEVEKLNKHPDCSELTCGCAVNEYKGYPVCQPGCCGML